MRTRVRFYFGVNMAVQERIIQLGNGKWILQWRQGSTHSWNHIVSADSLEALKDQVEKRRLQYEREEFAKSIVQVINLPPRRPTMAVLIWRRLKEIFHARFLSGRR